jgi:hypothetical protein
MPNAQTLIAQAYSAFNHRNIDSALALMSEKVSWPKASEGGRVVGKEEIRSPSTAFSRQWRDGNPSFTVHKKAAFIVQSDTTVENYYCHSGRTRHITHTNC